MSMPSSILLILWQTEKINITYQFVVDALPCFSQMVITNRTLKLEAILSFYGEQVPI